jgi:hypothetical protein
VPAADVLVQLTNTSGHTFTGLTLSYAGWWQANTPEGYVDHQTAVYNGEHEPPGAVRASGVSGVVFDACAFSHLASPYAVELANASSASGVSRCNFTDLSGGAVRLGSTLAVAAGKASPLQWDADLVVADCSASNVAIEFAGAPAIFAGYLYNASIEHNAVRDAGYTGISLGWGWGIGAVLPGVGANVVVGNRIERVLARLIDGGGIYLNGYQRHGAPPSLLARNYVSEVLGEFAALYLDNGASGWLVADNVVANSPLAGLELLESPSDASAAVLDAIARADEWAARLRAYREGVMHRQLAAMRAFARNLIRVRHPAVGRILDCALAALPGATVEIRSNMAIESATIDIVLTGVPAGEGGAPGGGADVAGPALPTLRDADAAGTPGGGADVVGPALTTVPTTPRDADAAGASGGGADTPAARM